MKSTKEALAQSLIRCLNRTALDRITINDIVKDSNFNRHTFYYHFRDIHDLLEWIFIRETEKMINWSNTAADWQATYHMVFTYSLENKKVIQNIYGSLGREYLDNYLHDVLQKVLLNGVENYVKENRMEVPRAAQVFVADAFKYIFVGFFLDWVRDGMKEDHDLILANLNTAIGGEMKKMLQRFEQEGMRL